MTPRPLRPEIGQWYLRRAKGEPFQVAEWQTLDLESGAAPEDWSGPIDTLEAGERGSPDDATPQLDWQATQHVVPPDETGEEGE